MQLKTASPLLDGLHFSCLGLAKSLFVKSLNGGSLSVRMEMVSRFILTGREQTFLHIYHLKTAQISKPHLFVT